MHQKHIVLCYKKFTGCDVSHQGMGVTAMYNAKSLVYAGYAAQALPIFGADDLSQIIHESETHTHPITHVVLMAQFIDIHSLSKMIRRFPFIKFAQVCHSNIAFLTAEPPAIDLIRAGIDLETGVSNFHVAGNNNRFCHAIELMFGRPISFLPNLYWIHHREPVNRPLWNGGTLKIGIFGSARIYKNMGTAIAAAVQLTSQLKCHSEIWINSGRNDGTGNIVKRTAVAWTKNLPHVTLKELHWASWPEFKRFVGSMNIHLAPSWTETFCNVVADAIAEGVPSVVVQDVIEWVPRSWQAEADDTTSIADTARKLLSDHHAAQEGYACLKQYVKNGLPFWHEFLERR